MMLKLGFVWMGEPVSTPASLSVCCVVSQRTTHRLARTVFDDLADENANLHGGQDVHHPGYSTTEPALLLLPPLFPRPPLGIHLIDACGYLARSHLPLLL